MACSSCKKPTFEMFTEEEEANITIVMEGNTYGRRAKLEETPSTDNLMILRNFQYRHNFFIWFVLLLLKDVFEGFGHRPLKLNHLKRNSQHLNLGLFEAIFIQILVENTDKVILRCL